MLTNVPLPCSVSPFEPSKMKIGIVGLGKLGMPVALGMNMKGHDVMGFDINPACLQKETFPHREIGPNGEETIEVE